MCVRRENPDLASRLYEAVRSGYRKGRRRAYDRMRLRGSYSLSPKWKPAFEACVQYCYSRGSRFLPLNLPVLQSAQSFKIF